MRITTTPRKDYSKGKCWALGHRGTYKWNIQWAFTKASRSRCWVDDFLESFPREPFFWEVYS